MKRAAWAGLEPKDDTKVEHYVLRVFRRQKDRLGSLVHVSNGNHFLAVKCFGSRKK